MIAGFFYIFILIIFIFFVTLIMWSCYINYTAMTIPSFEGGVKTVLIKLEIPEDAKRSSAPHRRKCRCNKAKVLEIVTLDKGEPTEEFTDTAYSIHDFSFVYKVGEEVFVDNFCEDRMMECAPGIHFFMEKEEALRYMQ